MPTLEAHRDSVPGSGSGSGSGSAPETGGSPGPGVESAPPVEGSAPAGGAVPVWRDYLDLTKPRLNGLVLVTTGVGYVLGVPRLDVGALGPLLHVMIGTALCAASGAVLNQWMEREPDRLMHRTRTRPLPAGRVDPSSALAFGGLLGLLGTGHLAWWLASPLPAVLAFATIVIYALVYTPLKRRTSLCTMVGAITGALPPLIGWSAARGEIDAAGWMLFAILFVWQMPHFLAIAWVYKDDYARAGFPMLPVVDATGRVTARAILSWSFLLLPVTVMAGIMPVDPSGATLFGPTYLVAAVVLGLVQIAFAIRLARRPERSRARALFFCTIIYLPLLCTAMVSDGVVLAGRLGSG